MLTVFSCAGGSMVYGVYVALLVYARRYELFDADKPKLFTISDTAGVRLILRLLIK